MKENTRNLDFLFVNPPSPDGSIIIRDFNRSGRTSRERIIWPQVSLAYLAAMAPQKKKIKILDCIAEKMGWDDFKRFINKTKPKFVVSQVITSTATNDLRVFKIAKKVGAVTMSMGPHVTELYKETFKECPELDLIMMGEPEITFKELIENLISSKKSVNLKNIMGIAFKKRNKIVLTKKRKFINNLDDLPIPRQDLLPLDKYIYPFMASKFTFVMASRGCPYPCIFCRQPIMWEGKTRVRSAESVMKELRLLKKIGVKNFLFHSDTFTIKKDVVIKLCKMMVKEKLNLKWGCNSRVDTVDAEMLRWMKKAGCWMIAYGIESGSDKVLKKNKKEATVADAVKFVNLTHQIGIKVYGYFIIGLLGETRDTIKETIKLAEELPVTFAIFHTASPYPGTEFSKIAIKKGFIKKGEWERIDQGSISSVGYPNLSSKEITRFITKAYLSFYLRPIAIFRIMASIRNLKDITHLFRLAINHLRW